MPPLIGGALSDDAVWRLSVCRVHQAYVENRETQEDQNWHRVSPRHMCLGHYFQGQKVKVTRPHCLPPCWRIRRLQRWAWEHEAVGNCCPVAVCSAAQGASAPTGEEGRGISWRPPTYSLLLFCISKQISESYYTRNPPVCNAEESQFVDYTLWIFSWNSV